MYLYVANKCYSNFSVNVRNALYLTIKASSDKSSQYPSDLEGWASLEQNFLAYAFIIPLILFL